MKSLIAVNKYFWKYRYRLLLGILFVILSNYFAILQPRYVSLAVDTVADKVNAVKDKISPNEKADLLNTTFYIGLLILGSALLRGFFMFLMRQMLIVVSRHIEYDQKNEIYSQYQALSLSFYRGQNTGDLMNRITEDVSRVRMYVGPAVMYVVNLLATFSFVIAEMLKVSPTLTLYTLLPLPFLSLAIYFVNGIIYQKSDEIQSKLSDITTFVQEAFSGIRVIKSFGAGQNLRQAFSTENESYRHKALELNRVDALFFPLMLLLIGLSNLLVIYIGGKEVIAGTLSYGSLAQFVIFVNMLTWPVASLGWVSAIIQRAAASQARINDFLQVKPAIDKTGQKIEQFNHSLQFNQVCFHYPGNPDAGVQNIQLSIDKGKVIGIIGATGSGKSTLAALALRSMDPDSGSITLDGINIKDLDLDDYRSLIGYVPQDVFLFSDTIEENIAFGVKQWPPNREKVIEAAKFAALHDNVLNFPEQYNTMLGERGISLSGGQKQRVAIARALIRNPEILVLDDCLSAVDMKTESEILQNFKTLFHSKTALIISHRVSSVKEADEIVVINEGKIAERGKHQQLLALNGAYAALYEKQTVGEVEDQV